VLAARRAGRACVQCKWSASGGGRPAKRRRCWPDPAPTHRPEELAKATEAAELAESDANRLRIHNAALERDLKEDALKARPDAERSPKEWLALAREVCRPIRCDDKPIDVNCVGGIPPEWARVQATVEWCLKPSLRTRSSNAMRPEDEAAWRKRVTGK
jgi:hypothetical protein